MVTLESGDRVGAFTELLDRAEGQYGRVPGLGFIRDCRISRGRHEDLMDFGWVFLGFCQRES